MIIGITGTDGAGKGTVVRQLVEQHGYTHFSSRDFIVAEIERQGLPVSRPQMRLTANAMRAKHGNEFVVRQALERAQADGLINVVIESVRSTAEAVFLRENNGVLLAVDADLAVRYARITGRKQASDHVTLEEFIQQEELEKNDPDPHGLQKSQVINMADAVIINNTDIQALRLQVTAFLSSQISNQ